MSDFDGSSDGLRLCARCHDQDTMDEICSSCKRELVADWDGEIGWREAWRREQEEHARAAPKEQTLEQLLLRLADMTERAQQIWEAAMRADEDSGYDEDDAIEERVHLTLERSVIPRTIDPWMCGWRVQQDEATVWALFACAATPLVAAQALLSKITPSPG